MIDEKQLEDLTSAIRGGSDLETACHFAGLSVSVVYRWLERGKLAAEDGREDEPFTSLWEALRRARAQAVVRNVAFVQKAAQEGSWQAAAWWLERTVPETYGKNRPARELPLSDRKELSEN